MAARKVTDAEADSVNVYARGRPVKGGKNWHFLSRSGAIQVFHGRQLQADWLLNCSSDKLRLHLGARRYQKMDLRNGIRIDRRDIDCAVVNAGRTSSAAPPWWDQRSCPAILVFFFFFCNALLIVDLTDCAELSSLWQHRGEGGRPACGFITPNTALRCVCSVKVKPVVGKLRCQSYDLSLVDRLSDCNLKSLLPGNLSGLYPKGP